MYEGLISIIVPVYNVRPYLKQCVDSIINQTYTNLEIILVDDGSTDGGSEICDQYAEWDNRVVVIHKQNGGLSDARNTGIGIAKSDFITFVDSDDYVSENYIYDMIVQVCDKTDMIISMPVKFYEEIHLPKNNEEAIIYNSEEALSDMMYRRNIPIYAWAKLYRKTLFNRIKFPKGLLYEDLAIMHLLMHEARQITYIEKYNYYYRQRNESIIHSSFSSDKMVQIDECNSIVTFIEKEYPAIVNAAYSKAFIVALNLYRSIPFSKEYRMDRKRALEIVNRYKYIVFKDRNNKKFTRLISLATIIYVPSIYISGYLYTYLLTNRVLRLKRPI